MVKILNGILKWTILLGIQIVCLEILHNFKEFCKSYNQNNGKNICKPDKKVQCLDGYCISIKLQYSRGSKTELRKPNAILIQNVLKVGNQMFQFRRVDRNKKNAASLGRFILNIFFHGYTMV